VFERLSVIDAMRIVREAMPPTPQQRWPLLDQRFGAQIWVKHENHTAVGAFKLRGGLVYFDALRKREPAVRGVVSATRGNHGQSVGFAAHRHGLQATIVAAFEDKDFLESLWITFQQRLHGMDTKNNFAHRSAQCLEMNE